MRIPPLAIAATAATLLVVVIAADATMNRHYTLEMRVDDDDWRLLAEQPYRYDDGPRPYLESAGAEVPLRRDENVTFRLAVENTHLTSFSEAFTVYANGVEVASGQLEAPARGNGAAEFTLPASAILGGRANAPSPDKEVVGGASLQVQVGDEMLYAYVSAREVTA